MNNKKFISQKFLIKKILILATTLVAIAPFQATAQAKESALQAASEIARKPYQKLNDINQTTEVTISTNKRIQVLIEQNTILKSENDILRGVNSRLSKSQRNTWFLYGAFAVLLGALLTSIIPALIRKKSYNEWQ
ncbi:MAG: ATP-dependent Lon protease [Porticoccus sp.]|jgi:ATP-dependent Lon protease